MIGFFARHPTAANLLMAFWLALGIYSLPQINRATFPEIPQKTVRLSIPYPGATAMEVENAICTRAEDAVAEVDNRKETVCDARENVAVVRVRKREEGDITKFSNDVQNAVDRISDFPEIVERPIVSVANEQRHVVGLVIAADMNRSHLKDYVEDVRRRMLADPLIAAIEVRGFTERQLKVEVPRGTLRALGLSVDDVARAISAQNIELPAGVIESDDEEVLLRFADERRSTRALADIVITSADAGSVVTLGDIATITDEMEQPDLVFNFGETPAAMLEVKRARGDDALEVYSQVLDFVAHERARTPDTIQHIITFDLAEVVEDRLTMLTRNGVQGLILVFLTMWLFFSLRYSFWVAMGLPVSFAGTFFIMAISGLTFDMISVVGLLIGIGLLMDDAIVIAENIAAHHARGKSPLDAAIDGTRQVLPGVASSFLTTLCIFGPLTLIEGEMGAILRVMPMVLIMTLSVSLVEAFLILPHHLKSAIAADEAHWSWGPWQGFKRRAMTFLDEFRDQRVQPAVEWIIQIRYVFLGSVVGLLILAMAMFAGGIVKFLPFPILDGAVFEARFILPQGTPVHRTQDVIARIQDAAQRTDDVYRKKQPGEESVIVGMFTSIGFHRTASESGPHVASMILEIKSSEDRVGTAREFQDLWRANIGELPDIQSLTITQLEGGPGGDVLDFTLIAPELSLNELKAASEAFKARLTSYIGVVDVLDDLRPGKPEFSLTLKPDAQTMGLTAADIANQVRAAFFGATAQELQVGREAYEIDVQLAKEDRNGIEDLDDFAVRTPQGAFVPLTTVAEVTETRSYAHIQRLDGERAVKIVGDVTGQANAQEIINEMTNVVVPELAETYPSLALKIGGAAEEAATSGKSIGQRFLLGLFAVYLLLAFQFRSYLEPVVVILIIPFSFIGVMIGHLLLGLDISMPSIVGFASLAGVVVNNSILLVTFIRFRMSEGWTVADASARAARDRFRPVLLTTATTVMGLLPILTESSVQAQILIPLVASLAFGLTSATLMVLFVVPAFFTVLDDFDAIRLDVGEEGFDQAIGMERPLDEDDSVRPAR